MRRDVRGPTLHFFIEHKVNMTKRMSPWPEVKRNVMAGFIHSKTEERRFQSRIRAFAMSPAEPVLQMYFIFNYRGGNRNLHSKYHW